MDLVVHFMNTLRYTVQIMNSKKKEDAATLEILQAIENKKDVTQRHLADKLGVALGLTNSYLKRCVRKGLIKIQQAPANRYFYYLTRKGFSEKSRLTKEYLSHSFDFYRRTGDSLSQVYRECEKNGQSKLLLCGISELAEIASIKAHEFNISIIGTWDINTDKKSFLGLPIWSEIDQCDHYDACLVTSSDNANRYYKKLKETNNEHNILLPSILGISTQM